MKVKLRDAVVRRAGVTARYTHFETSSIELSNGGPGEGVESNFVIDSKGGGRTDIYYKYGAKDYKAYLRMMLANDRQAALVAVTDVLREEIGGLDARKKAIESKAAATARQDIIDEADRRYMAAPYGTKREEAAVKLRDSVSKLVRAVGRKRTKN
jgi:hypothetical protein